MWVNCPAVNPSSWLSALKVGRTPTTFCSPCIAVGVPRPEHHSVPLCAAPMPAAPLLFPALCPQRWKRCCAHLPAGDGHSLVTWGREEHCTEGNLGNSALYPGLVPAECRLTNCFCLGKENKLRSELLGSKAGRATATHVPHHPPRRSQPTQHSAFHSEF